MVTQVGDIDYDTISCLPLHYTYMLIRDNPDVKAIFVVRLPISRMISHYKYSIEVCKSVGFESISQAVNWALRQGRNAFCLV